MYRVRISEIEIVDGDKKVARFNVLAQQAISLRVLEKVPDWDALIKAITKGIQLADEQNRVD